jgi:hypothetical protein
MASTLTKDIVDSNLCKNREAPDILRLNCDLFNNVQYVESSILDPVVSSSTYARFVIPPIGFLSPSSRLSFSLTCPVAMVQDGTANYFLPANVGIKSLIDRVEFKSGGKTINDCSDKQFLEAFKEVYTMPERIYNSKNQKEGIYAGKWKNMSDDPTTVATAEEQNVLMWDSQFEYNEQDNYQPADGNLRLTTGIEFSADLSSLFPFLQNRLLPMYLMKEQVEIILHFNEGVNYYRGNGAGGAPIGNISIDNSETKLALDHIIYPDEIMDSFRNTDKMVSIQDVHYQLLKRTLTKSNNQFKGTFDLGGKSRFVRGVIVMLNPVFANTTNQTAKYFNKYYGEGASGHNAFTDYNIRVNGEMHYPVNITNPATQFSELYKFNEIYGGVPTITRQEFFDDDTLLLSPLHFENTGLDFDANLTSSKNFIFIKLNKFINNRGLELHITRNDATGSAGITTTEMRAYLIISQEITIDKDRGEMFQRFV